MMIRPPIISNEHGSIIIADENQFRIIKENENDLIASFNDSELKIYFSYFIGVDWLIEGEESLYVEPKLNKDAKQTDYLQMLFASLKHPETDKCIDKLFGIKFEKTYIEIQQSHDLLTPLLVIHFLRVVQKIVRKGLKKSYYRVEHNLFSKIKGKIMVGKTIKQNLYKNRSLYTFCSFDEFGVNCLENRLLKKALVFVFRYIPSLKIPHSEKYTTEVLNYIMPAFEMVSEEVSLNDIKHSKTNIFYKEYDEGIRLAKLILQRFGYNINNTQQTTIKTPPFWIDMSKLFELFVLGLLKDHYGNQVKFQVQANYGDLDYLILNEKIVVDAKYKTYYNEDFTGQEQWKRDKIAADIRQISGYARDRKVLAKLGITKEDQSTIIPECFIIYPDQHSGNESIKDIYSIKTPIEEFVNFFKVPVKLPILP